MHIGDGDTIRCIYGGCTVKKIKFSHITNPLSYHFNITLMTHFYVMR